MFDPVQQGRVDRAYLGHAFLALAFIWMGSFYWMDFTTAQALGMLTGVPTALLALTGLVMATYQSLRLRRVWAEEKGVLLLLVVLVTVLAAIPLASSQVRKEQAPLWQCACLFLHPLVALPVFSRWFGFARRRHGAGPADSAARPE